MSSNSTAGLLTGVISVTPQPISASDNLDISAYYTGSGNSSDARIALWLRRKPGSN